MANRKATFAKRQREADLKERAKQKDDRRSQKRGETRDVKGPQIAWDEAVHAVTSDEPPLDGATPTDDAADDAADAEESSPAIAPARTPSPSVMPASAGGQPAASPGPAAPRRVG